MQLGYLEIPLLAQVNLADWLSLFAGPVYGIKVTDKAKIDNSDDAMVDGEKGSVFLGQGGIAFNFGSFTTELLIERGFTDVFNGVDGGKWGYIGLNFIYWFNHTDEPEFSYRSKR
jgi:hypothetical protein